MIQFLMSHPAIIGGLLVAFLDFIFAINPMWSSNGILHAIYLITKKFLLPPPPDAKS